MRVVSLLNSGADSNTVDRYNVCYCQREEHICMVYTLHYALHMYIYVEPMLHIRYRAQDVVQCTSIVGAVASAAVSSEGSYYH